jgi:hypothetical protein
MRKVRSPNNITNRSNPLRKTVVPSLRIGFDQLKNRTHPIFFDIISFKTENNRQNDKK